jgi:hypothetical protein
MKKNSKKVALTTLAFALSLSLGMAQTQESAIYVHSAVGSNIDNALISNVKSITFSGDNLLLNLLSGGSGTYPIDGVGKITFGLEDIGGTVNVDNLSEKGFDVSVYVTRSGEIVVESTAEVNSLTLFNIDGKFLQKTLSSSIFASTLPVGIYLLQIETAEGIVGKKFIKN